jgi:hypothetical protein
VIAVQPTDYVYPDDIRYDAATGVLYVRASGVRAMGGEETRVYEYDVGKRELRREYKVDPGRLPGLCP